MEKFPEQLVEIFVVQISISVWLRHLKYMIQNFIDSPTRLRVQTNSWFSVIWSLQIEAIWVLWKDNMHTEQYHWQKLMFRVHVSNLQSAAYETIAWKEEKYKP